MSHKAGVYVALPQVLVAYCFYIKCFLSRMIFKIVYNKNEFDTVVLSVHFKDS